MTPTIHILIHNRNLLCGLWALFVISSVFEFAHCFSPICARASPSLPPSPHLRCPPPQTSLPSTAAVYCCCLLLLPSAAAFHLLSLPAITRYNLHGFLYCCYCPHTTVSLGPSLPSSGSLALWLSGSLYKVSLLSLSLFFSANLTIFYFAFLALFWSFISLSLGPLSLLQQGMLPFSLPHHS